MAYPSAPTYPSTGESGGGGGGGTQPSLSVADRTDGEGYTITAGARSLTITTAAGATLSTSVELASTGAPVSVTGGTTSSPSWTAADGGTDGDAYAVRVVATLDGLTSTVGWTERVAGVAASEPSLSVAGITDGEAYTVTGGAARSLTITTDAGATLSTTVELATGAPVTVTGAATTSPSWTVPAGGTAGDAYQVRVVSTLDGLSSSVGFTERIAGASAPSVSVAGITDGEAYTVTGGAARSLTITADAGATLSTTVEVASSGLPLTVTDSTTTTPSWTAPAGGAAGDAYQVKVAATLGGLSSTVGFTERIAGTGGGSGLTAPTTAYRIDFTDEPTATWNGLAVAVTIDGVSGTYSTRDSTTFGIVNGQGWVIENTVPTTSSSATRFAGGQTNFDLAGNYTAGNLLVITWKVSGGYLDGANDIIVFGAWNNFGADGPGGSVFMNGDGTFDVVTFNNAGSSQTLATSTATHTNPAAYYIRQVLDTAAGVSRLYFSTSAPGTSTLSGGMTYLGSTRSDVVRAASNTPLDAMPSAFIQTRFYRGTNTGTPMTATVEYIDVLELAV
jgi:hypothetical protein